MFHLNIWSDIDGIHAIGAWIITCNENGCASTFAKRTCSSVTFGGFLSYSRLKRLPLHGSKPLDGGESFGSPGNPAPFLSQPAYTLAAVFHIPVYMFHWNIRQIPQRFQTAVTLTPGQKPSGGGENPGSPGNPAPAFESANTTPSPPASIS